MRNDAMMIDDEFKNERIRLKQIFNQCSSVINSEFSRDRYQLDSGESYYTDMMCNKLLLWQNYNDDNGV